MESGLPRLECEADGRIASIIMEIGFKWVIFDENFGFAPKINPLQNVNVTRLRQVRRAASR